MHIQRVLPYYFALFKSLNRRRISNLLLVETGFLLSSLFRKVIVFGRPWSASIEPTTSCNLRCPECPTGMQSLTRPKGNMSLEVFSAVLDKLAPELFYLTLYFQGEPLLNQHFTEMIKLARNRGIFVATSTNGHFLDERNVEKIIQSGLSHLIISIDGLDQETYEKYRVNGKLQTVTDGIKRLVEAKKSARTSSPIIELQFLVMSHNEHQMKQMRKFASETGVDRLSFKSVQVYNFDNAKSIIPTVKKKSRYRQLPDNQWIPAGKIRNRCRRIWSSLVITWDGKVVPCCYDKNADHQSGNLLEDSLPAIWKNHIYSSFRSKVISHRADIDICRNCGE